MWPYLVIFFIATIIAVIGEKCIKNDRKAVGILLLVLCAVALSVFAGLRTTDLGYDTRMYFTTAYKRVSTYSFQKFIPYMNNNHIEKGFLMYMYILNMISPNVNFVLWGLQFIVSIIVIIFAYNYREKCSIALMIFIYCCTLYAFSFNILRQSISVAFCLLMILLFEKKKYFWAIVSFGCSMLFHNSAIFMVLVPIICIINDSNKVSTKSRIIINVTILVFAVVSIVCYEDFIRILAKYGIIGSRYTSYLSESSSNYRDIINIEYSLLLTKIFTVFLSILYFSCKHIDVDEKKKNIKWFVMLLMDLAITIMSFKLANTDRISWYLYYPSIFIFVPQTVKIFKSDKANQFFASCVVGGIFLTYILEKLITNQYNIVPYKWIL